jgi:hypothetical protein
MPAQARIKPRRDTSANWASANPVLQSGEIGFDTTSKQFKIGDGTTAWSSLSYVTETPSGAQTKADTAESDAISAAAADATSKISTHAALTATHGATGAIVGTTNTQTLTNKTIDGNSNTLTVLNAQTTAASANTASAIVARDASGNFSANLVTVGTPTSASHAATKAYVDNVTAGVNTHASVKLATTVAMASGYAVGSADQSQGTGIGATLTSSVNGALTIDSVAATVGDRILVKDQTTTRNNGIYTVTDTGGVSTPWVLTRATDFDNSVAGEVYPGDFTFITHGTVNAGQGWIMNSVGTSTTPDRAIKIGTDNIVWTQFTGVANITAGVALTKTGNTLDVDAATQSVPGYLSAADKTKIDALEMPISFHIAGTLATGVKQPRFISPVACTLVNARAYAGGGSGVTYRLVKNGSTNGNTSATVGAAVVTTSLSTVTSLAVGDILQIEIVSAGTSGADLSVTIEATY